MKSKEEGLGGLKIEVRGLDKTLDCARLKAIIDWFSGLCACIFRRHMNHCSQRYSAL